MTIVCSSEVLSFYFHWFSSTDVAAGFVGLIFNRKENELPYDKSLTVTETVSTKRTFVIQLFVENCHSELRENSTYGFVVDVV